MKKFYRAFFRFFENIEIIPPYSPTINIGKNTPGNTLKFEVNNISNIKYPNAKTNPENILKKILLEAMNFIIKKKIISHIKNANGNRPNIFIPLPNDKKYKNPNTVTLLERGKKRSKVT